MTNDARILDRRYVPYDGPRLGVLHAQRSVAVQTVRRVLGLHRPARSKVLPFLAIGIAFLPAVTFIGLVALLPERMRDVVPDYADYYGFISAAILLFVTFTAPEALCPDRRSRLLSLYLASPLSRERYLVAKGTAVAAVIAFVTIGPPLLLLVGKALQGAGPDTPTDFALVLIRIVGAGTALSLLYTALSLGIASLTDRRAFASAGTLLVVMASATVAGVLGGALEIGDEVFLLNLTITPFEVVQRIYGSPSELDGVSTAVVMAAAAAYAAIGFGVAWWRYHRLQVTR